MTPIMKHLMQSCDRFLGGLTSFIHTLTHENLIMQIYINIYIFGSYPEPLPEPLP